MDGLRSISLVMTNCCPGGRGCAIAMMLLIFWQISVNISKIDIIKLQYTDDKVHMTSHTVVVVDFKASYSLLDHRGWQDGAVDCCLPSIGHDY